MGVLDENVKWEDVIGPVPSPQKQIVLDCLNVQRINSMGVRRWIEYFKKVQAKRIPITLVDCAPAIVFQVNNVFNFLCGAEVESIRVPYACTHCHHNFLITMDTMDIIAEQYAPPDRPCPECKKEASFDEIPALYFRFLKED